MSKRLILIIAVAVIFFSSAGIVTFLSAQEGNDPRARAAAPGGIPAAAPGGIPAAAPGGIPAAAPGGIPAAASPQAGASALPLETRFAPDRIYRSGPTAAAGGIPAAAPGGIPAAVWRVSRDQGVMLSADGGATWSPRNTGLPTRAVYPFSVEKPPIITCLAVDPFNPERVGITTLDTLFLSSDAGLRWDRIELKDPIRANDQLTCLALCPGREGALAIGTSFHGFFETVDRGKTWTSLSGPLTPLKLGGGNYEEVASLAYDPLQPELIWFNLGFGKGLYTYRKGGKSVDRVDLPVGPYSSPLRDISFHRASAQDDWFLEARTDSARWEYAGGTGVWKMIERIQGEVALSADKAERLAAASGRYGIYVSSFWASGKLFQRHLDFLATQGLNSIVLDFKDDNGYVTYNTELAEPIRIGAVQKRFSIEDVVKTAHEKGLYLIGRIVVFRDKQLYNADGFRNAAWDRAAKVPWRYLKKGVDEQTGEETVSQGEYWVDPYSEYVWDYNIAIAKELQNRGVDEVQFDYIRFPSDGDLGRITWRSRREGMGKLEALESFLAKTRESLYIPISTDVYGYCGWARISNWVAQNIETYSRYVDVIQPMFYPSHFPRDFLGTMEYLPRARYIYQEGSKRSAYIVEGRSIIRPYVQAFRIGGELAFTQPVYSMYLMNQVRGALEGASSGFTLWNASNDYYMVTVPLGPVIQDQEWQSAEEPGGAEAARQTLSAEALR